ncbi:MAG: hypothetical protein JST00_07270 [Deltaproteobacteria bacterium]|nr:hypothetical protein [Deltaproteobacteria bacterium]
MTRGPRTHLLACAALGLAVALAPGDARADDIVPSLSVQTGVLITRSPGNDSDDYFVAATPAISYFIEGQRTLLQLTYAFTGSLNMVLPNGVANRLAAAYSYDISPATRLLIGAEGLQSLIGNYLLVRRSAATRLGGIPALNTSLVTANLTQGVTHEISPVVRLTQNVNGTYVTSIDPEIQLRNYLAVGTIGIDRSWEFDAVGAELGIQYARVFFPPLPTTNIVTMSLGPTWDHDISPTLSTSMAASVQVAVSPDEGTTPRIGPAGRASILYSNEGSGIGAEYAGGIEPNLLLGTLLRSHQFTLRGFTPLSERYQVVLGLSSGYLIAENATLDNSGIFDNSFQAVLHDADITWTPTDFLSMFVRYQFIGQTAGEGQAATPAIVRHGALFGIDLFASRPTERNRLPATGFPKRVDRNDDQNKGGGKSGGSSSGLPQRATTSR